MLRSLFRVGLAALCSFGSFSARAQTVQPVIAEYTGKASGAFTLTNNALTSMAVVLEPKSFSIDIDGNGHYRPLDPDIHLELSSNSVRLLPRQSTTIFYKVTAPETPSWLCIYADFMPLHPGPGINVHVLLPHTVYLYSRHSLTREDVQVNKVSFNADTRKLTAELTNLSPAAGRVEQVHLSAGHTGMDSPGFPLLPGQRRRVVLDWTDAKPPQQLALDFANFSLKLPVDDAALLPSSLGSSQGIAAIQPQP